MSLNIDEQEARLIWLNDIMPFVFRHAKTQEKPVTVFLGGQSAAGKTSGQDLAKRLHPGIIPIVGDDYRQYHPDYRRLLKEDPLRMPDETAGLAGRWTGMCVDNADEWGYPIIIEGTWRNVATVLDEARRCKALRRATHAIVVATPPLVSRAGIIDRFCSGLLAGNTARWTPLEAHDRTVRALRSNVPLIAGSGLIDRFTVTDRSGGIIADGTPSEVTAKAWMSRFDAPLTSDEQRDVGHAIDLARRCQTLMTPEDYERVMEIVNKLDAEMFDLTVREYMESGRALDFLPVLKGGDSYTVRLNEGLRFGGFPFHRRPRCGRLAPTPVLRRLHGRLTTRRVPPRRECSRPHSSHGRAGRRT